jgi:hypothetical protein
MAKKRLRLKITTKGVQYAPGRGQLSLPKKITPGKPGMVIRCVIFKSGHDTDVLDTSPSQVNLDLIHGMFGRTRRRPTPQELAVAIREKAIREPKRVLGAFLTFTGRSADRDLIQEHKGVRPAKRPLLAQ